MLHGFTRGLLSGSPYLNFPAELLFIKRDRLASFILAGFLSNLNAFPLTLEYCCDTLEIQMMFTRSSLDFGRKKTAKNS